MPSAVHDTQHARYAVGEAVSLLASHRRDDGDGITNTTATTLVNCGAAAKKRGYIKTHFVILITLVVFIIDVAFSLINAPQTEVFEHIICNAYYKRNPAVLTSNRSSCVVDAVQSELAILTQFKDTLDMLPCKFSWLMARSVRSRSIYGCVARKIGQTDVEICKTTAEKQRHRCNASLITQVLTSDVVLTALALAIPYGILAETFGRKPILLMSMVGIAAEMLIDVLICGWSVFPSEFCELT
ncbi:MAG: hypothetical protein LQ337_004327 [Flavoplaca oasis]|nr:MAG: hypothetical protein LQ337_004327 [Flavoplaca oasis]